MSERCDACRLYFPRHNSVCPRCGGPVLRDSRTDGALEALGYRAFAPSPQNAGRPVIQDGDLLASLRRDYERQYTGGPAPQDPPAPAGADPGGEDYFSRFHAGGEPFTPHIDLDPPERPAPTGDRNARHDAWYEPPAPRREGPFARLSRSASALPWPLLLRIGFVVLVIALLATLWAMRWVLVQGLLSLFTALLPGLVILWLLWYIIRGGRRR